MREGGFAVMYFCPDDEKAYYRRHPSYKWVHEDWFYVDHDKSSYENAQQRATRYSRDGYGPPGWKYDVVRVA